jgi:glutamine amidotransferase
MKKNNLAITVINYGAGNLGSVANALVTLGCQPRVTDDPTVVMKSDAVFFPGVGAAADTMRSLRAAGLDDAVRKVVAQGKPLFAICVGLQVLLSATEEGGEHECLGIIPGRVRKLPCGLKIPHMGWNQVRQVQAHPIFEGIPDNANFYFVHSYYPHPIDDSVVAGLTEYGIEFCSMVIRGSLFATQFHPEKSGKDGLRMYSNFLKIAFP